MRGKSRLLLIKIDRDDVELDRRAFAQMQQHIEQRVTVLAARQAHHDLVAGAYHVEIADRLPGQAAQAFGELVRFVLLLLDDSGFRRVH